MVLSCGTRIGSSIAAAGEPCSTGLDPNATVQKEITWGQQLRDHRATKPPINLEPRNIREVPRTKLDKQVVMRPEPMQNMHPKRLFRNKLLNGSNVVNRGALSSKQHIALLAVPKKNPYYTHLHRPVLKYVKGCTPRVRQLSVPNRHTLLSTYYDYQNVLPYKKIDKIYEVLQNYTILDVPNAETYFEDLERTKLKKNLQNKRKQNRRALQRQRHLLRWINRRSEDMASKFADFLCGTSLLHLSHTELKFSEQILECLRCSGKVAQIPPRTTHSVFERGILQASNQAAHFAMSIVVYFDDMKIGWEDVSTSTVTTTSISVASISEKSICLPEEFQEIRSESLIQIIDEVEEEEEERDEEEDFIEEPELEEFFVEEIPKLPKIPSKVLLNFRMTQLVGILEDYYQAKSNDENLPVFESGLLPDMKFHELLKITKDLKTSGAITGPFEELVNEIRRKITDCVKHIEPDKLDPYMQVAINMVAYELAMSKYNGFIDPRYNSIRMFAEREAGEGEGEEEENSMSLSSEKFEQPDSQFGRYEGEMKSDKISVRSGWTSRSKRNRRKGEGGDSYVSTEVISQCPKVTVVPHSPTMACCASVQAWALWTKEVADNAGNWCLWIHQTLSELRRMAAIVRGEVISDDGHVVVLHHDEWNAFVSRLNSDVARWRSYNEHVQSITEDITDHFRNKTVQCCAKCLEEGYDLHQLEAEHLTEQLLDALNTTQFWSKWLNAMVKEAIVLSNIIDVPDEASIYDASNTNEVSLIADTMLQMTRNNIESPSLFSIDRVPSQETKKKNEK